MTLVTAEARFMDPREFRSAIGAFATGVAVVTTEAAGELHGMTINSLTSVSLRPTLLLICLTRPSRTASAVTARGAFIVNLLGANQGHVSNTFARPAENHFNDHTMYTIDEAGMPRIVGAMAHLVCEVEQLHEAGDHTIFIGRVVGAEGAPRDPLIVYRGAYDTLSGSRERAELDWYW
jgi:3-hydroxy-9,10-secoandrosta-1,3,5(10)-triene-9,17-dione monooxygenase reductase component